MEQQRPMRHQKQKSSVYLDKRDVSFTQPRVLGQDVNMMKRSKVILIEKRSVRATTDREHHPTLTESIVSGQSMGMMDQLGRTVY